MPLDLQGFTLLLCWLEVCHLGGQYSAQFWLIYSNPASDVPTISHDVDIPSVISAEQKDRLLKLPPHYTYFIPLSSLPVSVLVDSTPTLPDFDPALTELDTCKFFSSVECNTSNFASSFFQHSIPPLHLSSRLLDTFEQAVHDGAKSMCDPHFPGNLPCWVLTYWYDVGHAVASKQTWSLAHNWLARCGLGSPDIELAAAIDKISCALQTLGWDTALQGPGAFLQTLDLAEFLDSTPMKGHFVDAMVNEISHRIQSDTHLHKTTVVEELTFGKTLRYDAKRWSQYMFDRGFTRICELGDLLCDGKLTSVIFPININDVHWTVFLVDAKNREICYGDSLGWTWPREDVDLIQKWLHEHGFTSFSKGAELPHGHQEDAYSCAIAMINIIRHQLFDTPLFTDDKKDLLHMQELIFLLHGHFSEDNEDNDVYMSDYSPSSPCLSHTTSYSRSPSPTPSLPPLQSQATALKSLKSRPKITLNYRVSPSEPKTGLLKHFSIVSHEDYLADIHQCDLKHKDKQHNIKFSRALKDAERKHQKCINDRDRQRAHRARAKELKRSASENDTQVHSKSDPDTSALQSSQSLAELSRPHCSVKEELHC
ncbi:uncharacterized protein HD556DRAFT_1436623 [Suillus plorans]|uniref:Ubiquitin-like protease family profile domain-containing protein n=1 Tax=Suillus plorans TaxID=116603 RepID=A0A9P7DYW1_9AGAM|nr:uncharacterized protein HD556DRAFT_1436623 [Suillus plorans]KAG1806682.1 hypothetical protein HD556DRAFT_1436623 [Suillus plorans]